MKNCTGERCLMQYDKFDPATCKAVDYCPQATPPRTKADRIRAMTDEELARLLTDAECPSDLGGTDKCKDPPPHTSLDSILCRECWLAWLRQEATT